MGENFFTEPEETDSLKSSEAPEGTQAGTLSGKQSEESSGESEEAAGEASENAAGSGDSAATEINTFSISSEQFEIMQEYGQTITEGIEECTYLLSALLFFFLFDFAYNRIKAAVKYFCGRRDPYERR